MSRFSFNTRWILLTFTKARWFKHETWLAWVRFVSSPCALFSPVLGIHPWCALDFSHPPGNDEEAAIIYTETIFDIDEGVAAYRR